MPENQRLLDFNPICLTHPERQMFDGLLAQYEKLRGKKVQMCDKCKDEAADIIFFFFERMVCRELNIPPEIISQKYGGSNGEEKAPK